MGEGNLIKIFGKLRNKNDKNNIYPQFSSLNRQMMHYVFSKTM